jgi:hypothetical protein
MSKEGDHLEPSSREPLECSLTPARRVRTRATRTSARQPPLSRPFSYTDKTLSLVNKLDSGAGISNFLRVHGSEGSRTPTPVGNEKLRINSEERYQFAQFDPDGRSALGLTSRAQVEWWIDIR